MGGLSGLADALPSPWDPLGPLMPRGSAGPPSAGHGSLAGVSVVVKDMIAVRGLPARAGSRARSEATPEVADAPVVTQLRGAGADVVGTAGLHEFGFGVTGVNEWEGTPPNPHDESRIPGGSSSGSAVAVADGSARLALGTDTGGSVRIPAALCGVVGFKPGFGAYSTKGVLPLAPSLDHLGLLARRVADVRAAHEVIGGPVAARAATGRLGFSPSELDRCSPAVRGAVDGALRSLRDAGWELVPLGWPDGEEVTATNTAILFAEAAAVHRNGLLAAADRYGEDVRGRLELGTGISAEHYVVARHRREALTRLVRERLAGVDAVVGPTVPIVAPPLANADDLATISALVAHTRLANLTGFPAVSIPIPRDGLPVGLQVLALTDERALALAGAIEAGLS